MLLVAKSFVIFSKGGTRFVEQEFGEEEIFILASSSIKFWPKSLKDNTLEKNYESWEHRLEDCNILSEEKIFFSSLFTHNEQNLIFLNAKFLHYKISKLFTITL